MLALHTWVGRLLLFKTTVDRFNTLHMFVGREIFLNIEISAVS